MASGTLSINVSLDGSGPSWVKERFKDIQLRRPPYVVPPEWGHGPFAQLKRAVEMDSTAFGRLSFKVLAMGGENFTDWQMPGHE